MARRGPRRALRVPPHPASPRGSAGAWPQLGSPPRGAAPPAAAAALLCEDLPAWEAACGASHPPGPPGRATLVCGRASRPPSPPQNWSDYFLSAEDVDEEPAHALSVRTLLIRSVPIRTPPPPFLLSCARRRCLPLPTHRPTRACVAGPRFSPCRCGPHSLSLLPLPSPPLHRRGWFRAGRAVGRRTTRQACWLAAAAATQAALASLGWCGVLNSHD